MIHQSWVTILFISYVFVVLCNALLASFSASYYKKVPLGRLTHSQLRVKQGNATLEQRFNVAVLALLFGIPKLRNLLFTIILAVAANFIFLALP